MMKKKLLLAVVLFIAHTICFGQKSSNWAKWDWLIGDWAGEGSGNPGQGSGIFSLKPDLDNTILIRKNHSEYPATKEQPKIIHDDIMIIYSGITGNESKAIYFDNEGHTINYSIKYTDSSLVMTSDKIADLPVFRLTYYLIDKRTINVKFEMSKDGEIFATYTEGKCRKL